jgi:GTPase SAR1 family protein
MKLGIFGQQGSGKSLIAMVLSRSLQSQDPTLDIYTNMNVDGKNIYTIHDLADLPLNNNRRKVFIVDEAYFTLDSRNSSSKQNRIWSKVFALFRKSDVILTIFITHRPRMIDVNIREQLDYILMCRKNPNQFDYLLLDTTTELTTPITLPKHKKIYDYANYDTRDFPLPISVDSLQNHPLFKITK